MCVSGKTPENSSGPIKGPAASLKKDPTLDKTGGAFLMLNDTLQNISGTRVCIFNFSSCQERFGHTAQTIP